MTGRGVLIGGNALAALCLASPALFLLNGPGHLQNNHDHMLQHFYGLMLPAAVAAGTAAWWHTRDSALARCTDARLAVRILFAAYLLMSVYLALFFPLKWFLEGSQRYGDVWQQLLTSLLLAIAGGVVVGFVLMVLTVLPALFVEYTVVRLARSRWVRGASSRVMP